jgi:hypothetical protein
MDKNAYINSVLDPGRKMEWGRFAFFEFFAGGGIARLGLGAEWKCEFAKDCCAKKKADGRARH